MDKYDTPVADEKAYQSWALRQALAGFNTSTVDYDMRGLFKEAGGKDLSKNASHGGFGMTDRYKKPNHPTFSNQSIYHFKDGAVGGYWGMDKDGNDVYYASNHNLKNMTPEQLKEYFSRVEPGVKLVLPSAAGISNTSSRSRP
jgi:hypothetical protein